jgi:hypothetical protein
LSENEIKIDVTLSVMFYISRLQFILKAKEFRRKFISNSTSSTNSTSSISSTLSQLSDPASILRLFLANASESSIPPAFFAQRERLRRQTSVTKVTELSGQDIVLFLRAAIRSTLSNSSKTTTMVQSLLSDPRFTAILKEALAKFHNNTPLVYINKNNSIYKIEDKIESLNTSTSGFQYPFTIEELASMAHDISNLISLIYTVPQSTIPNEQSNNISSILNINPLIGNKSHLSVSLTLCDDLLVQIGKASDKLIHQLEVERSTSTTQIITIYQVSIISLMRSFFRAQLYQHYFFVSSIKWMLNFAKLQKKKSNVTITDEQDIVFSIQQMAEASYILSHMITFANKKSNHVRFSNDINTIVEKSLIIELIDSLLHSILSVTHVNNFGATTACHLILASFSSTIYLDNVIVYLSRVNIDPVSEIENSDTSELIYRTQTNFNSSLFTEWPIETILKVSLSLSKRIQIEDTEIYSNLPSNKKTPITIPLLEGLLQETKRRVELLDSSPLSSYGNRDQIDNDRMDSVSLLHAEQIKKLYSKLCYNVQYKQLSFLVHELGITLPPSVTLLQFSKDYHNIDNKFGNSQQVPYSLLFEDQQPIVSTFPAISTNDREIINEEDEEHTPLLLLSLVKLAAPLAHVHDYCGLKKSNLIFHHHRALLSQAASDTLHVSGLLAVSHALLGLSSAKIEVALLSAYSRSGIPHRALFAALARRFVARASDFGGKRLHHLTLTEITNSLFAFALAWEFDQDAFAVLLRELDKRIQDRHKFFNPSLTSSTLLKLVSPASKSLTFAAAPDFEWGRGRAIDLEEGISMKDLSTVTATIMLKEETEESEDIIDSRLSFISYSVSTLTPFSRFVRNSTHNSLNHIEQPLNHDVDHPKGSLDSTLNTLLFSSVARNQLKSAVDISANTLRSFGLDTQTWVTRDFLKNVPTSSLSPLEIPLCVPSMKLAFEFVSPESIIAMPTDLICEIERIDNIKKKSSQSTMTTFLLNNREEHDTPNKDEGERARNRLLMSRVVPSLQSMWRASVLTSDGWSVQFIRLRDVDSEKNAYNYFRELIDMIKTRE